MDSFSPSAPARVRTLILPVGRIKRSRFNGFLDQITSISEVRLGDVTPDPRPERSAFSPLEFPDGQILYTCITSLPAESHLQLAPFELFREPLVLLGLVDGAEYHDTASLERLVVDASKRFEEEYPRLIVRKIMIFDHDNEALSLEGIDPAISISLEPQMNSVAMRTVMCGLTSLVLAEMTTLAASLQALPSIPSPSPGHVPLTQRQSAQSPDLSRPTSQGSERPSSAGSNQANRMSMPVLPSNGVRPGSPESAAQNAPARTFEEMMSSRPQNERQTPISSRDSSQNRVSISGFGPGSIDERKRNQGKVRVSIVVSCVYILAGRWSIALRDLTEAASRARSFSDHIWHAKALEQMLLCMLLLAWRNIPFKIPPMCYPILERTTSKLAQIASAASPTANGSSIPDPAAARRELANVLPDMVNMILSIYERAASHGSDYLPDLAYFGCVIRLSRVLASTHLGATALDDTCFEYIIQDKVDPSAHTRSVGSSRYRLVDLLMRSTPASLEYSGLSTADHAAVLAGMSSVLSVLGMHRKKALLLKEFVQILILAMEEARRSGAAEAGVHPSTNGLKQPNTSPSISQFASLDLPQWLNLLGQAYGITSPPGNMWFRNQVSDQGDASPPGAKSGTHDVMSLRLFGSVNMKSDILRICVQLCEALSDLRGILYWTSCLLRAAGPGTAPSSDTSEALVSLSREEQLQLHATIERTVANAQAHGLADVKADFWDEFLVRGVIMLESSPPLHLHPHKKADLLGTGSQNATKKGPFIHNPFLEKPKAADTLNLLVAGEEREFIISLQNPYDFDVNIETVILGGDNDALGSAQNLVLKPYRTQSFSIRGICTNSGRYDLETCTVRIRGCHGRAFAIFEHTWQPILDTKIKQLGLRHLHEADIRPSSNELPDHATAATPSPSTISLIAIPPQPILEISSLSPSHASLMLLEGERATFQISIRNTHPTVTADFVHVSFRDTTLDAIEEALAMKSLSPADLYELEYQVVHNSAVRLLNDRLAAMTPGAEVQLEIEVVGKPGLTNVLVLIDYANVEREHIAGKEKLLYTRQISQSVTVTVNTSIQMQRLSILPVTPPQLSLDSPSTAASQLANLPNIGSANSDEFFLLVADLRNAWPIPLEVSLASTDEPVSSVFGNSSFLRNNAVLQPGHTSRFVLLLPKLDIQNPHARIRSANERQYVVSAGGMDVNAERNARELFWFREGLLKLLHAHWKEADGAKTGHIDMRSFVGKYLVGRMIDTMRREDIHIEMNIDSAPAPSRGSDNDGVTVRVDEPATLVTRITNKSPLKTIYPILRLTPSLPDQQADVAQELSKRIAWSGLLQQSMPPIPPGKSVERSLCITSLCAGEVEWGAVVEERRYATQLASEAASKGVVDEEDFAGSGASDHRTRRRWAREKLLTIVGVQPDTSSIM